MRMWVQVGKDNFLPYFFHQLKPNLVILLAIASEPVVMGGYTSISFCFAKFTLFPGVMVSLLYSPCRFPDTSASPGHRSQGTSHV